MTLHDKRFFNCDSQHDERFCNWEPIRVSKLETVVPAESAGYADLHTMMISSLKPNMELRAQTMKPSSLSHNISFVADRHTMMTQVPSLKPFASMPPMQGERFWRQETQSESQYCSLSAQMTAITLSKYAMIAKERRTLQLGCARNSPPHSDSDSDSD